MSYPKFARVRPRIAATLLDLGLLAVVWSILAVLALPRLIAVAAGDSPVESLPGWAPLVALPLSPIGFPVVASFVALLTRGRTPGMLLVGTAIRDAYGERPTRSRLLLRGAVSIGFAWLAMAMLTTLAALADRLGPAWEFAANMRIPLARELVVSLLTVVDLQLALGGAALWIAALIWARHDERGRTWQDMLAGTTVVAVQ